MYQPKILLVEDDPLLQKLYLDLLKAENFLIETASEGIDAYNKIKKGGYDLVLLDIMLPNMSGIEIMKKMKNENVEQSNKKIVFITNVDAGEDIKEAKNLNIEYIVKSSLNPEEFINRVKKYL